jgi:hypothetical protein
MPAGTVLSPGWVEAVERHIRAVPARGAWLPQRATVFASWRGRLLGLPRHAPALLLPLSLYRAAGGFPPVSTGAIPALARRLGGGRLRMLPVTALPPPASTAT